MSNSRLFSRSFSHSPTLTLDRSARSEFAEYRSVFSFLVFDLKAETFVRIYTEGENF